MKYYNGKLRLGGKADNEILLEQMSAPEIMLMRRMHGPENVFNLEETTEPLVYDAEQQKMVPIGRDDEELFEFLTMKYTKAIEVNGEDVNMVAAMFGGKPLPTLVNGAKPMTKEQKDLTAAAAPALGRKANAALKAEASASTQTPGFLHDAEDED